MTGINNIEKTLYYQWLINNNSTSTMLNAISGVGSVSGLSGLGDLGSVGSVGNLGGSFASILQSYMTGMNAADSLNAASMADKLSGLLEEAEQTEDTGSLSYKTAKELYEYFSNQVSTRANALLGNSGVYGSVASSLLGRDTSAATVQKSQQTVSADAMSADAINENIRKGQEIDFSKFDAAVDSAFAESMPVL